jgi:hypothetical protein
VADTEGALHAVYTAERIRVWLSWLYVGIPLAWGVAETILKSIALFR